MYAQRSPHAPVVSNLLCTVTVKNQAQRMLYQSQKRHALVARERKVAVPVVPVATVTAPETERLTTLTCNGNDYVKILWNNYIDVWTGFILITL